MMTLTCGCEVTVTAPARIERVCDQHGRISLRDHFAGQALQGMTDNPPFIERLVQAHGPDSVEENMARVAYKVADAMLAERSKE